MELRIVGNTPTERISHFEKIVEYYEELEQKSKELLDCSFGLSNQETYSTIDIEVAVKNVDKTAASNLVAANIFSAIRQTQESRTYDAISLTELDLIE